jgi:Flp pilus assembly pilin Flp
VAHPLRYAGVRHAVRHKPVIGIFSHGIARRSTRTEEAMDLVNRMRALVHGDEGQDLLEYALLVALIALIAYGGVQLAGGSVNTIFNTIAGSLAAVA